MVFIFSVAEGVGPIRGKGRKILTRITRINANLWKGMKGTEDEGGGQRMNDDSGIKLEICGSEPLNERPNGQLNLMPMSVNIVVL
jgi:hypothetical protein